MSDDERKTTIVVSAPHETKGADLLELLARNNDSFLNHEGEVCSPKTYRSFGEWEKTDFGSRCRGIIRSEKEEQGVVLEIGSRLGIIITEVVGDKYQLYAGEPGKPIIEIGARITRRKLEKAAKEIAAHLLKGYPPTPKAIQRFRKSWMTFEVSES